MSTTTEQQQERLHRAHEHLRHDSTSDSPEVVRERIRQVELSNQRQAGEAAQVDESEQYADR